MRSMREPTVTSRAAEGSSEARLVSPPLIQPESTGLARKSLVPSSSWPRSAPSSSASARSSPACRRRKALRSSRGTSTPRRKSSSMRLERSPGCMSARLPALVRDLRGGRIEGFDLVLQPRAREAPLVLDARQGQVQDLRHLAHRQAREEAQLDDLRLEGIEVLEPVEGLVEDQHLLHRRLMPEALEEVVAVRALALAAALQGGLAPRLLDEDV